MEKHYTAEICTLYREYIGWSATFLVEHGCKNIIRRMFLGNSEYNKREEHIEFFKGIEAACEEFLAKLEAGEGREELLPLLQYTLVQCHHECDECTEWMLLAAEKCMLPLAELLNEEEATELWEPYRKLRRKNRGMPPQDEMRKILKKKMK